MTMPLEEWDPDTVDLPDLPDIPDPPEDWEDQWDWEAIAAAVDSLIPTGYVEHVERILSE